MRLVLGLALLAGVVGAPGARAEEPYPPHAYVTMSDGTSIAVGVHFPKGYDARKRYPAVLDMSGYEGASANYHTVIGEQFGEYNNGYETPLAKDSMQLTKPYIDRGYIAVHASARGTGCSGGEFDLFSWRAALDGREVIEWMAAQPWSNRKVGLVGHSYSGITGFMIAATRPPHLVASSLSGLIDDLYRGIAYPGGVSNIGFPVAWTGAIRPAYDVLGGTAQAVARKQDPQCVANQATHSRTVLGEPFVQGVASDVDNDWWRSKALTQYAHLIDTPTYIQHTYQDEQTGPRGSARLWEMLARIPKRLQLSNGDHSTWMGHDPHRIADRVRWIDHWMGRRDNGYGRYLRGGEAQRLHESVDTLLEVRQGPGKRPDGKPSTWVPNGIKRSRTFPLEDTRWTDFYLRQRGALSPLRPTEIEPVDRYVSGTLRHSWNYQAGPSAGSEVSTPEGPDGLRYVTPPMRRNTAVVGPITADLWLSSTEPDTEVFLQLVDIAPNGDRSYLQRGLLKTSHRAWSPALSDRARDGHIYRPWRPHTNPAPVVPGTEARYFVEIWPVGHVFRAGHRIALEVHAPPAVDGYYAYAPRRAPAVNMVIHDRNHPSKITLPVVSLAGVKLGPPVPCGQQQWVRCIPG